MVFSYCLREIFMGVYLVSLGYLLRVFMDGVRSVIGGVSLLFIGYLLEVS